MTATLLAHESALRLLGFGGIFAAMALWEVLAPRRNIVTVDNRLCSGSRWIGTPAPSNIRIDQGPPRIGTVGEARAR